MKTIILIILLLSTLNADKIIISGLSYHGESKNIDGTRVNPYNYGIGYRRTYQYDGFSTSATVLVLNDSFNHVMVSATYGIQYNMEYREFDIDLGMEFGVAYKKILHQYYVWFEQRMEYEYRFMPVAFLPTISVQKDRWSLEMIHVPELDYDSIHVIGATLFLVGYEF